MVIHAGHDEQTRATERGFSPKKHGVDEMFDSRKEPFIMSLFTSLEP